jgi:RecG-like helicase
MSQTEHRAATAPAVSRRVKDASRRRLLCDRFLSEETWERVKFFSDHAGGFALAEEDLRLRGPGDAWGVRQHGTPGFKLANPVRDAELARAWAAAVPLMAG